MYRDLKKRFQLDRVTRRLPQAAVRKLPSIRIRIEEREPAARAAATFHPDAAWLSSFARSSVGTTRWRSNSAISLGDAPLAGE
jgi:hypothetical protein